MVQIYLNKDVHTNMCTYFKMCFIFQFFSVAVLPSLLISDVHPALAVCVCMCT